MECDWQASPTRRSVLLLVAFACAALAPARDAYVLLSGGGTPLSNNYSQYLQARAVADHLARTCPPESVWVFFGAGNRPDAPPILADARRETRRDGLVLQSWEPGILRNNRAATRDNFLRALRDEILPTVRDGGTLHLFVGDHGELAGKDDARESAITMWQLKPGRRGRGWITDDKEVLGVAETVFEIPILLSPDRSPALQRSGETPPRLSYAPHQGRQNQ